MGVVVLHADRLHALECLCVLGRQVLGMEVVRHGLRLDREQPLEVLEARRERTQRLVVLEVADVMAGADMAQFYAGYLDVDADGQGGG